MQPSNNDTTRHSTSQHPVRRARTIRAGISTAVLHAGAKSHSPAAPARPMPPAPTEPSWEELLGQR
jgi:hypothetical protein